MHLAVDAWCDDLGLAGEAEVLEVIDAFFGLLVVNDLAWKLSVDMSPSLRMLLPSTSMPKAWAAS